MNDAKVSDEEDRSIKASSETCLPDAKDKMPNVVNGSSSESQKKIITDTTTSEDPNNASTLPPLEGPQPQTTTTLPKRDFNRFPEKLLKILDSEDYVDIFSWSPSGKSFVIHKPYELISQVLTKHFDAKEDMKFDSFLRKLYRWGFSKKTVDDEDGDEEGAHIYFHSHFQKGNLDLCAKVMCTSKPATSRPSAHQKNNTPFMPYMNMMPPQMAGMAGMFPNAGGMLPGIMTDPQQQASLMMGADIYRPSQFPGVLNGAASLPVLERDLLLQRQRQELRERELLLIQQQQQLYNSSIGAPIGASAMLGQPVNPRDRLPLRSFEQQQQFQGFASQNIPNPHVLGGVVQGGMVGQQDMSRFDQMSRFQNGNSMMGQTNGMVGGMIQNQQDSRKFLEGKVGGTIGAPRPSSSTRVDELLAAERQAQAQVLQGRGLADPRGLNSRNLPMVGSSLLNPNMMQPGSSQSGPMNAEEMLLQRRMLLMSQESQQQNGDNSLRKRDSSSMSGGNQQNFSSDQTDLQRGSKRANR